jgi:hypothetical protein
MHLVGCFIVYLKMHGTTNPKLQSSPVPFTPCGAEGIHEELLSVAISSYPLDLIPWSSCISYFVLYCPSPRCLRPTSSSTGCPTRYRTRHFFNNSNTNNDVSTKQTHTTDTFRFICHTTNVFLFKFRCNIFICVRFIKEMPGWVASGTSCIFLGFQSNAVFCIAPASLPKFSRLAEVIGWCGFK